VQKSKYLLVIFIILYSTIITPCVWAAESDFDKEKYWKNQLSDKIKIGGVIELKAGNNSFFSIYTKQNTAKPKGSIILLHAIYADGSKSVEEDRILQHLAQILGFSPLQLSHLESMISANLAGPGASSPQSSATQLTQAYALLGVDVSASDSEVKKAYRRMMSQHHPDKLVSKGLPEEMIKLANEKTQQIKKAYDLIKAKRDSQ